MKLADLRKLSIKQQARVRFQLRNGMECVVTEHGIAQVAGLRAIPDFNLEEELAAAREFLLEPAGGEKKSPAGAEKKAPAAPEKKSPPGAFDRKTAPAGRSLSREELTAMIVSAGGAAPSSHEEE